MNKKLLLAFSLSVGLMSVGCKQKKNEMTKEKEQPKFEFVNDAFADIQLLRYQVKGFDELTLNQKELAYYLYEAALCGRDMMYDQRYKHNIAIRKTIENIYNTYKGDKSTEDWKNFETYAKRVWFSNGIHHHYSNAKFVPEISNDYFRALVENSDITKFPYPVSGDGNIFVNLEEVIFNPNLDAKLLNQAKGVDIITTSSNNLYEGVTQKEAEDFYSKMKAKDEDRAPEFGLNSKLIKVNGNITEKVYKIGGMYSPAIEKMVYWLNKAVNVAENENQKTALEKLVKFYTTGDVYDWDEYNIAWVNDINSDLDISSGFIEVYLDALGRKGSFETVLSMKDKEASVLIEKISKEAQWFEDNSPILPEHKKDTVKGISAKVITVIVESGDAAPSTPIGINLPNNRWVREKIGSKSVSLGNIVDAYNIESANSPVLTEFEANKDVIKRLKEYSSLAGKLHTDMHEVIGHASGKREPGVDIPAVTLKQYSNSLEEARADLVALYFIMDKKLVDMEVMPSLEVGKAEYDNYILNGMITQLTRIKLGDEIEEAHMRNRQLVASWAYEKGKADNVIEFYKKDNKTYIRINDYLKLRTLFGELLKEIQRVISQGDFKSGEALIENYGVKIDQTLHAEILDRYNKLDAKAYKGFIQPKLVPVMDGDKIKDVKIEYPDNFVEQMLYYGNNYSFLPIKN